MFCWLRVSFSLCRLRSAKTTRVHLNGWEAKTCKPKRIIVSRRTCKTATATCRLTIFANVYDPPQVDDVLCQPCMHLKLKLKWWTGDRMHTQLVGSCWSAVEVTNVESFFAARRWTAVNSGRTFFRCCVWSTLLASLSLYSCIRRRRCFLNRYLCISVV